MRPFYSNGSQRLPTLTCIPIIQFIDRAASRSSRRARCTCFAGNADKRQSHSRTHAISSVASKRSTPTKLYRGPNNIVLPLIPCRYDSFKLRTTYRSIPCTESKTQPVRRLPQLNTLSTHRVSRELCLKHIILFYYTIIHKLEGGDDVHNDGYFIRRAKISLSIR